MFILIFTVALFPPISLDEILFSMCMSLHTMPEDFNSTVPCGVPTRMAWLVPSKIVASV